MDEKTKILVIDGYSGARHLLKEIIEREGLEAITAGSAKKGLELWQENKNFLGLVITGFVFKGEEMDGADILNQIRKENSGMPVIGISGVPEQLAGHGFTITLAKPFSNNLLREYLSIFID